MLRAASGKYDRVAGSGFYYRWLLSDVLVASAVLPLEVSFGKSIQSSTE